MARNQGRRSRNVALQLRKLDERIRALLARPRLDAKSSLDGKDHSCLALPADQKVRPPDRAPGPDSRRGIGPFARPRLHRPLAYRPLGTKQRLKAHKANLRKPGGGLFRLFIDGLHNRRKPWRLGRLGQLAPPPLAARNQACKRHGSKPHGDGQPLGR